MANPAVVPPPFPATGGVALGGSNDAPPPFPPAVPQNGPAPPPFPSAGGMTISNDNPPAPAATAPQGGFTRNVEAGALSGVQSVADLGKTLYERVTNPQYQPKITGYRSVGKGMAPVVAPETPVPSANVPDVSKFIQNTSTTSPVDYVGQSVGNIVPFVLANLIPGVGEDYDAGIGAKVLDVGKEAAKAAVTGAASGAGAAAGNYVDGPAGALWGSLIGGAGAIGAGAGLSKIGFGSHGLAETLPVTPGLKARYAAQKIQQFAPDAREQLMNAIPAKNPVEGSLPTAAQAARSPELARLEGALTDNGTGTPLIEWGQQQSQARAAAINKIAPENAQPAALSNYLDQARTFDDENANSAVNVAEQSRGAAINAPLTPKGVSIADAQEEGAGAAVRNPIAALDTQKAIATSKLYNDLDERNPSLNMAPMRDAAAQAAQNIEAKGLRNVSPEESSFYARAHEMGVSPSVTWQKVNGFRTELNDAISRSIDPQTGRNTAATARLTALKRATDDATNTAIDRDVTENPGAYASTLANQASLWKQAKTSDERQSVFGSDTGPRPTGTAQSDSILRGNADAGSGVSAISGTLGQAQSGFPNAENISGVAKNGTDHSLNPPWSQQDIEQYRAALKSHAQRMGLLHNKFIAPILRMDNGDYRMPDDKVVQAVLPGGANSAKMATLVKNIAKERPDVLDAFGQAVALNLKKSVVKDGLNVNRNALARWSENHSGMLRVFPEITARVKDLDGAQAMVDVASQARETALEKYQHTSIAGLLNGDAPEVAMQKILNGSPESARQFMSRLNGNKPALDGARRAMANNMVDMLTKPTQRENQDVRIQSAEAMLRNPRQRQILNIVLGPKAETVLRSVAEDLRRTNTEALRRPTTANSATAYKTQALKELNEPTTMGGQLFREATPMGVGIGSAILEPHTLSLATGLGALKSLLNKFSANRVAAAQKLLAKTLTSPEATMLLLKKYSRDKSAMNRFVISLSRALGASELGFNQREEQSQ